jgi:uncharacterized protein (TIGR00369 family)
LQDAKPMQFLSRIPFVQMLGFELVHLGVDEAQVAVDLRTELTNAWDAAHGGLTMTLLDVALAHAARSPCEQGGPSRPGVVTIEMKTSFMRPGTGRLVATGRRLHRTATLAFCEGSVRDAAGELVAHATGTGRKLKGLSVGGRRIERADGTD